MVCSILKFHRKQKFIICTLFISNPYFLDQGISKISLFYESISDHTVYGYCWDLAKHRDSRFLQGSEPWSRNNKRTHTPHLYYEDLLRKAYAVILFYITEFSWPWMSQNEPPKAQKFSHHMPVHPPLHSTLCPLPLLTLCLPKKLTSVSPEGSISHKPREGLCPCTYTDRLTRSGWCFHKLRGLALTQQRKSLCLWGITPIPISKKGYRGEEAYSLIDQKKRPSKTETSAMTICKKEGCCQLSSPQNSNDLCLDPQKPDTQEQALLQELRALHQRLSTERLVAQAIYPEHLHSHSKDVSVALEWL